MLVMHNQPARRDCQTGKDKETDKEREKRDRPDKAAVEEGRGAGGGATNRECLEEQLNQIYCSHPLPNSPPPLSYILSTLMHSLSTVTLPPSPPLPRCHCHCQPWHVMSRPVFTRIKCSKYDDAGNDVHEGVACLKMKNEKRKNEKLNINGIRA